MNYWTTIHKIARTAAIILLVVVLICIFLPKYQGFRELQRRKAEMSDENNRIRAQTMEVKNNQERFATDPAFVERTARKMGMVKPDETLFKFTTGQSRTTGGRP